MGTEGTNSKRVQLSKIRWWLLSIPVIGYLGLILFGTLGVTGHSALEWVHLVVPAGPLRDLFVDLIRHLNPVTFDILLNLADTVFNLLLFWPLGMVCFWSLQRLFPDSIRVVLLITLALGLLLSVGIETFQALVPRRIPSASDVVANTGGAVFGCYFIYFRRVFRALTRNHENR
jgi:VanZ family protein